MSTPSQMSLRRIPDALHLRVRIAYANAWEALIGTHTSQALQFVYEFTSRTPALRALDLYFEVVAVPAGMQESVRTRCLTSLELESLPLLAAPAPLRGWQVLRVARFIERQQYRRRFEEKTQQLARMVGARAAEAVIATHVENAIGLYELLRGVMPVEQVAQHYLREFSLASSNAQMVWQRVQARVAGEELTAQYTEPPPPLEYEMPEEEAAPEPEPEPEPQPEPVALASAYPESLGELEEEAIRTRSPHPDSCGLP
jgi:hypothetical protein